MASDEPEPFPDICDFCGRRIGARGRLALVPDSSAIHARDPGKDGQRLIIVCSPEHLASLEEEYRRRPFVAEELWAGKISRALQGHPEDLLTPETLSAATGLSQEEIDRAVIWKMERIRRWYEQHGDDSAGDADPGPGF
ncbi:hypothetical protein QMK19_19515 [Streptomyces sp. H10-C2]|uniref:hypothetical protein n=1 Tax=unclassified Streptomyces TaxID=2593676 RepID=UPI0024BAFDB1|nr:MULTISPECIES: hypothetical protein [unclassified Streptomyces]MDJ0343383.1 hypothetical protein [Streptomyces sp. PH10-H1]MDJ0371806.1 hypothetical protein [Streptomyces sp. H10-C2]